MLKRNNKLNRTQRIMVLAAITATIFLWASAFVGIKIALDGYSPTLLAVVRFIVASISLFFVSIFVKVDALKWKDVPRFIVLGIFGISFYNLALNYGELSVSAAAASFIINTVPILTILLSVIFYKERINRKAYFCTFISFLGIALICCAENEVLSFNSGSFFILIAAFCQSIFFVLQKPLLEAYSSLSVICYAVWIGTFCMLPFLLMDIPKFSGIDIYNHLAIIYLGIFPGAVGYLTWTFTLSKMPASTASSFLYLIPIVTILIGIIVLKEIPSFQIILGGVITLIGVISFNLTK